ncbi:MAG: tetratricopeptide repeat protein, partial [Proteobacteria bacterium]|nr:tetratricopeptide repeat protein [Pseudomonadota bacterium]
MTDIPDLLRAAADSQRDGRFDDAEAAYRAVLAQESGHIAAQHNLGVIVARRGDAVAALGIFDRLLGAEPYYAAAHFNRGNALRALGRASDAIEDYRTVLAIEPDHYQAHRALGFLWLAAGDRDRSLDHFARTYDLRRGDDRNGMANVSLRTASRAKLQHDADLFRHLPPRVRDGGRFELLARIYESVADDLPAEDIAVELTDLQLETVGPDYNTAIHLVDAPELPGGAVNPALDGAAITGMYRETAPGIAWFDDLLTPKALALLQRYLRNSTIWHDFTHIGGFVAAYLEDGMASPLVLQIADEFRQALPELLGPHPLTQAWAFKGLRGTEPIDVHADDAAVSLNFWITPDTANRNPDTGGLVVYREPPPADWPIVDYTADRARIRSFLAAQGETALRVGYAENRAVLFDSRLFHGSDAPDFAPG